MCCRLSYGEVNCTELDYIGIRYVLLLHEFSLTLFYLHEYMYVCARCYEILHAESELKRDLILTAALSAPVFSPLLQITGVVYCRNRNGGRPTRVKVIAAAAEKACCDMLR